MTEPGLPATSSNGLVEALSEVPPEREPARDREPVLLHVPVNIRSASLVTLATLGVVFVLHWAAAVFIPLMLSLLLTYALAPLVDALHRIHVPRWIGAAVILFGLGGMLGGACDSMFGRGTIEFRPKTLVAIEGNGSERVMNHVEYRGDGTKVAVLPQDPGSIGVLVFDFNTKDRSRAEGLGCVMARLGTAPVAITAPAERCANGADQGRPEIHAGRKPSPKLDARVSESQARMRTRRKGASSLQRRHCNNRFQPCADAAAIDRALLGPQ